MNEEEFRNKFPWTWPDFVRLFADGHSWAYEIVLPVRVKDDVCITNDDQPVYGHFGIVGTTRGQRGSTIELTGIDSSGRCELRVESTDNGRTWVSKNAQLYSHAKFRDFVEECERVEQERPPADLAGDAAQAIAKAEKVFKDETDRVRRR